MNKFKYKLFLFIIILYEFGDQVLGEEISRKPDAFVRDIDRRLVIERLEQSKLYQKVSNIVQLPQVIRTVLESILYDKPLF